MENKGGRGRVSKSQRGSSSPRLSTGHELPSVACSYAHVVLLNMPLRASVASHSFSRWSGCFRMPLHEPRDLRGDDGAAPLRPHSQPSSPPARVLKEQGLKCYRISKARNTASPDAKTMPVATRIIKRHQSSSVPQRCRDLPARWGLTGCKRC